MYCLLHRRREKGGNTSTNTGQKVTIEETARETETGDTKRSAEGGERELNMGARRVTDIRADIRIMRPVARDQATESARCLQTTEIIISG